MVRHVFTVASFSRCLDGVGCHCGPEIVYCGKEGHFYTRLPGSASLYGYTERENDFRYVRHLTSLSVFGQVCSDKFFQRRMGRLPDACIMGPWPRGQFRGFGREGQGSDLLKVHGACGWRLLDEPMSPDAVAQD